MNIFIIEDCVHIQKDVRGLLNKRKDVNVIGACASVKCALETLPLLDVDLLLLDVELEDGNCFELLQKLEQANFYTVFITAYDEYAIKAIKSGAMDYLLKPIKEVELHEAIEKCKTQKLREMPKEQKQILLQYTGKEEDVKKIVVRTLNEMFFIDISQIQHCKGEGNYTTFYLFDGKIIVSSKPLREYKTILPQKLFIKTHQSYIVNRNYVSCYRKSHELVMKNDVVVPVSVRHKESVIKKLSAL